MWKRWKLVAALFMTAVLSMLDHSAASDKKYCYAEENYPYIYFGSKSSYDLIRQKRTIQPVPKCVPVKLWMLSRHGTRYPSKQEIKDMKQAEDIREKIIENDKENLVQLCSKDIQQFNKWVFNVTADLENELTSQGREELRLRAARMKDSFPKLFNVPFTAKQFLFQTTTEKRTVDSAIAFAEGMLSGSSMMDKPDIPPPATNDALLHSKEQCPKWQKWREDPETFKEVDLFKESIHVKNMVYSISRRLGFKYNLTLDDVYKMYEVCRYEKAWYIQSRPAFCAVFSDDDFKVLEFLEDMDHYYKCGYASDMNPKLACPLVKDMIHKFSKAASNSTIDDDPPVTLYFTHSSTILQFLTALALKQDSQSLTHDKFESMMRREWRLSLIDPFGSNFVAVFYKCEDGDENNVIFYMNEDIVSYPGCRVGLCSWDYIVNKFKSFIDPSTCNLDFCDSASSASPLPVLPLLVVFIVTFAMQISS